MGMGINKFFYAPRQGLTFSVVEITITIIVNVLIKHKRPCLTTTPNTKKGGYL